MTDETIPRIDDTVSEEEERLFGAVERDARRYDKAFTEEEEARYV